MKDNCLRLSAALAYYTLFSLAPLLVIVIAIAGFVFGQEAARGEIVGAIDQVIGPTAAKGVQEMVKNSANRDQGTVATIIGVITLLLGATGVFGQLQTALNTVWGVEQKKSGIKGILKDRFLSFAMILGVGFLLLVSLVISAGLAAVGKFLSTSLPGGETVWQIINMLISLGVITVLFAMMFKLLPDKKVEWREVWVGAAFTSLLFALGKLAIGIYLGKSSLASTYGAAASLAILLVWLYYSGIILFFGAEFTEVYARRAVRNDARTREECAVPEPAVADRKEAHRPAALPAPAPAYSFVGATTPAPSGGSAKKAVGAGLAGLFVGGILGLFGGIAAIVKTVRKIVHI